MHGEESSVSLSTKDMILRLGIMLSGSIAIGVLGNKFLFGTLQQSAAVAVFTGIIMGTLFFWNFRLAIAFIGLAVLICTKSLTIPQFVGSSSLEVILFLVGMMIIVGALRDLGFFTWVVQLIVSMPNISGKKFIFVTGVASALLACAVDEVTSIIFISTLIFQVCDRLKLNPTPYIIIAVLCTNVGSAGTMMGNPVGIYIGTKAGLTFGDFMMWSFPIMLLALCATAIGTIFYYRKDIAEFDAHMRARLAKNLSLAPAVKVPYMQGLLLLLFTIASISLHVPLEKMLDLPKNSILLIAPLVCSGIVMILKRERARHYVEHDVDWWTLVFFMLLFAIAGTLEHTHVDKVIASEFSAICGTNPAILVPFIMGVSAIGSAFVDNVIFVAAFCPVIEQLSTSVKDLPLWWALLFGACFGGNITMIGSTANIVALGMIEKRAHSGITFFKWLKIGLIASILAGLVGWAGIMLLEPFMPDRYAQIEFAHIKTPDAKEGKEAVAKVFNGKNVILSARSGGASEGFALTEIEGLSAENYNTYQLLPPTGNANVKIDVYVDKNDAALNKEITEATGAKFFRGRLYSIPGDSGDYPAALILEQIQAKASGY